MIKGTVRLAAVIGLALTWGASPACGAEPTKPVVLTKAGPEYPQAAYDAGHQGDVEVAGKVQLDGSITEATLRRTSGSAQLDQAAVDAFSRWTFEPARDEFGLRRETTVSATFVFAKDCLESCAAPTRNVFEKSCRDFVTDVQWFTATFPDRKRSDMPLYNLTAGMRFATMSLDVAVFRPEQIRQSAERFAAAYDQTYERCQKRPDARFFDLLKKAW